MGHAHPFKTPEQQLLIRQFSGSEERKLTNEIDTEEIKRQVEVNNIHTIVHEGRKPEIYMYMWLPWDLNPGGFSAFVYSQNT